MEVQSIMNCCCTAGLVMDKLAFTAHVCWQNFLADICSVCEIEIELSIQRSSFPPPIASVFTVLHGLHTLILCSYFLMQIGTKWQ